LRTSRDCGYGILHIDLLLERARLYLLCGEPQPALDDLRVALDQGYQPPRDSGFPGPLLKDTEIGGVQVLWVLARDCNWRRTPLKDYQAAFSTEKSLATVGAERDSAWVTICETIEAAANA
jgi:hypothetical protein